MSGDLAEARMMLVNERREARRSIALGTALIGSLLPAMWLGAVTNDVGLLGASLYATIVLFAGGRWLAGGVLMHSSASLKLRRLHARDTGLPSARLL